jgi:hypothetical protein
LNTGLVLVFFSYGLLLFSGNFCSFFSFIIFALIFDNILYMRNINVNVLSKRYFTKKTIKNQFFGKRSYLDMNDDNNSVIFANRHKHISVTSFEAQIEKNYILSSALELGSNSFLDVSIDKNGEIHYGATKETIDLIKLIDHVLCSSKYFGKKFICAESKELESVYNNNVVLSKKAELPIVGLSIMNYTTKFNPDLQLVFSNVIKNDYLLKGIALHGNNALLGIIKNDLDYARIFFLVNHFFSHDLKQQQLIQNYAKTDVNIEEIKNNQTIKLFSKMPIAKFEFNNTAKTKEEFLSKLLLSWQNIKGKQ